MSSQTDAEWCCQQMSEYCECHTVTKSKPRLANDDSEEEVLCVMLIVEKSSFPRTCFLIFVNKVSYFFAFTALNKLTDHLYIFFIFSRRISLNPPSAVDRLLKPFFKIRKFL